MDSTSKNEVRKVLRMWAGGRGTSRRAVFKKRENCHRGQETLQRENRGYKQFLITEALDSQL